ncbi:hypothetical protein VNO77_02720 [Canavalia gladiata]|uniref:Uncharacterized protein n=1 Tax=Canavalia gladiata TaxID=3824 RepID=A0AAN9R6C6_CANGL
MLIIMVAVHVLEADVRRSLWEWEQPLVILLSVISCWPKLEQIRGKLRRTTPGSNFPNHDASHRKKSEQDPRRRRAAITWFILLGTKLPSMLDFPVSEAWYMNANAWSAMVNGFSGSRRIPAAVTCMHGALNIGEYITVQARIHMLYAILSFRSDKLLMDIVYDPEQPKQSN